MGKNLGVKEGGGHLLEGSVFSETYGIMNDVRWMQGGHRGRGVHIQIHARLHPLLGKIPDIHNITSTRLDL